MEWHLFPVVSSVPLEAANHFFPIPWLLFSLVYSLFVCFPYKYINNENMA